MALLWPARLPASGGTPATESPLLAAPSPAPPAPQRLRRLRRWRRLLAPGAREAWVKELGPELRGLRPASGYQARLEVELVMGPPGAALGAVAGALHAEELVWLQDARGQWRMVPGLLDPGGWLASLTPLPFVSSQPAALSGWVAQPRMCARGVAARGVCVVSY